MSKLTEACEKLVVESAKKAAISANGAASWWAVFQPEEPEALRKLIEQQEK
ncbi:cyclic lactone autoinducer peptide [Lachnospiraceae bacterium LCP25S3_G4]